MTLSCYLRLPIKVFFCSVKSHASAEIITGENVIKTMRITKKKKSYNKQSPVYTGVVLLPSRSANMQQENKLHNGMQMICASGILYVDHRSKIKYSVLKVQEMCAKINLACSWS